MERPSVGMHRVGAPEKLSLYPPILARIGNVTWRDFFLFFVLCFQLSYKFSVLLTFGTFPMLFLISGYWNDAGSVFVAETSVERSSCKIKKFSVRL